MVRISVALFRPFLGDDRLDAAGDFATGMKLAQMRRLINL